MNHLLRIDTSWTRDRLGELFASALAYDTGNGQQLDGCAVLFFPASSLRTRVSFELGAAQMGLRPITLPPETLDKPEASVDVAGYLSQWADVAVIRHPQIGVLDALAAAETLPIVNAMTDENHPCEILGALFSISRTRDPFSLRYLFVGADGNIARAWQEAATAFGLDLVQCCPESLATPGVRWTGALRDAVRTADVVLSDGPGAHAEALAPFRISAEVLDLAPAGVQFAPCPPFERGREVTADAVLHPAFVGYAFTRQLLPVQQAILAEALRR